MRYSGADAPTTPEREGTTKTASSDNRRAALERAIRLKRAAAARRQAARSDVEIRPADRLPRRPDDRTPVLGPLQRSLWLLARLEPDSAAYNVVSTYRVTGTPDLAALERAFSVAVARHRILRSTFEARDGQVVQVIHPATPVQVERLAAAADSAHAVAVAAARRRFDLARGPLLRLHWVAAEGSTSGLLVLVLHHIVADERSLELLWTEVAERYRAGDQDTAKTPTLAAAPHDAPQLEAAQYDDYVDWQHQQDTATVEAQRAAWRAQLTPLPSDLALPIARPTAPDRTNGRLLVERLGRTTRERVERLAATIDATPFDVLAFAFRLLLHRYSDSDEAGSVDGEEDRKGGDIAFGTPVSARAHPATAEMVGYFLNTIVVRSSIDDSMSVDDALRRFRYDLRRDLARIAVPFDVLIEDLAPPRRDRHPLFQAMFVYQSQPTSPDFGRGLTVEPVMLDLGVAKFELTVFATVHENGIDLAAEYRTDILQAEDVHRLLVGLGTLVEGLAEDRQRSVSDVPLLGPEDERRIATFARGPMLPATDVEANGDLLPHRIRSRALETPESLAVMHGDAQWTYAQLDDLATRVGNALAASGVVRGDRVGLFLDRGPMLIAGALGVHLAGAAYVPLDPAYPAARNRAVLEDAEVAAIVSRTALHDRLPDLATPVIDADALDSGSVDGTTEALHRADSSDPAYLLYTSGSTGRPKGVVIDHGNLRASTAARSAYYGPCPGRFLLLSSIAFDSSVAGLFWTLAEGGTLVLPSDDDVRDPARLATLIQASKVTSLLTVPSLYRYLLDADPAQLSSLDTAIVAGEACPPSLIATHVDRLPDARLFNEYGPTEATVWASVHEMGLEDSAADAVSIGGPIPGVQVEVLDGDRRRRPIGVPGEAYIAGPTLASGYWRRPEQTASQFAMVPMVGGQSVRMYRTGDRMAWDEAGRLRFLGRVDNQIKVRGHRIEPGEIESLLESNEAVAAAAVIGVDDRLLGFVEVLGAEADLAAALRSDLETRLPSVMVPQRIVVLESLPRLPNGKIDRRQVADIDARGEESGHGAEPLLDEREQSLRALWGGLLGRPGHAIGLDDNFFRLGGHSLQVVEMARVLGDDFGVALTPADIFQHPTLRQLVRRMDDASAGGTAQLYKHLFPIQPGPIQPGPNQAGLRQPGAGQPRAANSPFIFAVPHFFSEMAADFFRAVRPVYGLRGVSLRPGGNRGRWPTMEALGVDLADEVVRRFGERPILMAGYSFGASMAFEAVRQLESRGIVVERLILIAPMALDRLRCGPLSVQLDGLREPLDDLSRGQRMAALTRTLNPLARGLYDRLWRTVVVRNRRRLRCILGEREARRGGSRNPALASPLSPAVLHADVRLERFRLHAGYRPTRIEAPTVIFNPHDTATDAAATWRPHFAGPLDVVQVDDPHRGPEQVRATEDAFRDHLHDLGRPVDSASEAT